MSKFVVCCVFSFLAEGRAGRGFAKNNIYCKSFVIFKNFIAVVVIKLWNGLPRIKREI